MYRFLLLGLGTCCILVNIALSYKIHDFGLFTNTILMWGGAVYLARRRYSEVFSKNSLPAIALGSLIVIVGLIGSLIIPTNRIFIHSASAMFATGLTLLGAGFRGISDYRQSLLTLCFLMISPESLARLINIAPITAKFSTVLLALVGIDAIQSGISIHTQTGAVRVSESCAGFNSIIHLTGIAFLLAQISNFYLKKTICFLIGGAIIGFIGNGIRVAALANLSGTTLEYWHLKSGAQLFTTFSMILLFALWILFQNDQSKYE